MKKIDTLKKYTSVLLAMFLLAPSVAWAQDEKFPVATSPVATSPVTTPPVTTPPVPTDAQIMAQQDSSALISVNGVDVPKWMFDNALRDSMRKAQKDKTRNVDENAIKKNVLQNLIDMEVLYQEAKRQGFAVNEAGGYLRNSIIGARYKKPGEFRKVLAAAGMTEKQYAHIWQQQASVNQLLGTEILDKVKVQEEEVVARYEKDKHTFTRKPQIQASHILIMVEKDATAEQKDIARKKIEELHKFAVAGSDFAALAKEHSHDGTAKIGGNLGYFSREEMVKPFSKAAFSLKTGEISGVVETSFGYHIIKKTGEQDATPSLDEMRVNVTNTIKNEKGMASFMAFKEKLVQKAVTKINDATLEGIYHAR